eukprot:4370653-Amphidinium_carterae.1
MPIDTNWKQLALAILSTKMQVPFCNLQSRGHARRSCTSVCVDCASSAYHPTRNLYLINLGNRKP